MRNTNLLLRVRVESVVARNSPSTATIGASPTQMSGSGGARSINRTLTTRAQQSIHDDIPERREVNSCCLFYYYLLFILVTTVQTVLPFHHKPKK